MISRKIAASAAMAAGIAWVAAGPAHAQPLGPEELDQALAAPAVAASFAACAQGYPPQGVVKLVVAAPGDGTVGITATVPTVDTSLLACLRAVAATVQVRASGAEAMMVVSMDFGGTPAPAAPPPVSAPVPPSGAAYVYAVPDQPPAAKPAPSYDPALLSMRSKGTALTIPGAVLAGIGGLHMLIPLMAWVIGSAGCDPDWDDDCWGYDPTLFAISMAGFAAYTGGIAMVSKGSMLRNQAGALLRGRVVGSANGELYGRGAGMGSLGAALFAGGGVAVLVPLLYGVGLATACGDDAGDCAEFSPGLLGVGIAGVAAMGTGVALLVVGSRKKNAAMSASASAAMPQVSFAPMVTKDAVGLGVLGVF